MEESGSEGLDDLIKSEVGPGKFFDGVDCVCISDNYWLNDRTVRCCVQLRKRDKKSNRYTGIALLDLRPPRHFLLQSHNLRAGERPTFWGLWKHGARGIDPLLLAVKPPLRR